MKKCYVVREDSYEGREIKKFKNEREAVAFLKDDKNLFQYGSMTLLRMGDDGSPAQVWNEMSCQWQEYKVEGKLYAEAFNA